MTNSVYRGRFAPSPTGELHFGSLITALGSYIRARQNQGEWLIRIEDIDPLREVKGSMDSILKTLANFGMISDRQIVKQSMRRELYVDAMKVLFRQNLVFACGCSRSVIKESGIHHLPCSKPIPETHFSSYRDSRTQIAWRARIGANGATVSTSSNLIKWNDVLLGAQHQDLFETVGDFVVWRADNWVAYQLAVVVDDAEQGITEVVRGADLLDSTGRQIWLQRCLKLPSPSYLHLPLALDTNGKKLSKSIASMPIQNEAPLDALRVALKFLGHEFLSSIQCVNHFELLSIAIKEFNWSLVPTNAKPLVE